MNVWNFILKAIYHFWLWHTMSERRHRERERERQKKQTNPDPKVIKQFFGVCFPLDYYHWWTSIDFATSVDVCIVKVIVKVTERTWRREKNSRIEWMMTTSRASSHQKSIIIDWHFANEQQTRLYFNRFFRRPKKHKTLRANNAFLAKLPNGKRTNETIFDLLHFGKSLQI